MQAFRPFSDVSQSLRTPGPDAQVLRQNLSALGRYLASWGFVEPQLLNGWMNYATAVGGDFQLVGYGKDPLGVVHLRGLATGGTISATVPMFVLPQGLRPPHSIAFAVDSNNAHGRCTINAGGQVFPEVGNTAAFFLDGITFKAG